MVLGLTVNARNLICWAAVLVVYAGLFIWGNWQPIGMEPWGRSAWAKFWKRAEALPLPGQGPRKPGPQRPAPPPPPPLITRQEAEEVIRISSCAEHADELIPRLRRSIRVSPLPVDAASELTKGASRLAAVPDVPAGFQWPQMQGRPLDLIAQIRLSDLAPLDEDGLLPKTGWLCFFYAWTMDSPPTGTRPADRGAWQVVYFDTEVSVLQRTPPPKPLQEEFPPCNLRFWKEWTLPSSAEEPELLGRTHCYYADLCTALTARPKEAGWHHLLGYAQNVEGPMRPACQLASNGVAFTDETDMDDPQVKPLLADVKDWILLLQVELGALRQLDAEPEESLWPAFVRHDRLYFWIRQADLSARAFSRVWVQRQGGFGDHEGR
jgi:uncharacterized protein YwqG